MLRKMITSLMPPGAVYHGIVLKEGRNKKEGKEKMVGWGKKGRREYRKKNEQKEKKI